MKSTLAANPNATASGITGAVAVCVIWIAGAFGLEMDAAIGTAFATVLITVVLAIGRRTG